MENKIKKELTPQQQQQRKKLLVYPAMGLVFVLVMYLIFAPSMVKENKADKVNGFNADVPGAKDQDIVADKKTAYEQEQQRQKEAEKMRTLQDFAFALNGDSQEKELDLKIGEEEEEKTKNHGGYSPHYQSSNNAYRDLTRELNSIYEPEDSEKKELQKQVENLQKQLEANQTGAGTDQTDLMEKSYKLAAKYLNPGNTPEPENKTTNPAPTPEPKDGKETITPVSGYSEKIVSHLEQPITDSAFMAEYIKPRNLGFNTAITPEGETPRNTIRACVYQTQTLNFGSGEDPKVNFRLLETIQAGTLIIPRNTTITGDAKLSNGRLEITITNLEYAGNIIPVKLKIYNLDGQPDITAPGSSEIDALKEAAGNMSGNMGTAITFTQNAGQQVAADLAKTAVQTGAQYLSKKIKTVKVTLKANHEVFILTSNN